jgi:RNA polymerase sigma-70 factor (ECF subfamily)
MPSNDVGPPHIVSYFQTENFDSRLWELYLLAAIREQGIKVTQPYHRSYVLAAMDQFTKDKEIPAGAGAMTEASLVAALKAGDKGAAENFVRTHAPWMLAVAQRVTDDFALAEDCVQEAFINVFRKIGDFEERSSLKTWLHRIVVNQALMKLRARRNRKEAPIDELLPAFDTNACRIEGPWQYLATPEEVFEREDRRVLIHSKIKELPESYRIILQLRDIEELTTREVAEGLGLSEENVRVRLHRARSALKKLLEPILKGDQ